MLLPPLTSSAAHKPLRCGRLPAARPAIPHELQRKVISGNRRHRFIGAALVKGLVAAGARVRSLDNDSRGSKDKLGATASEVELLLGDIRDPAAVAKALHGMDGVCHLAYVNGTEFFYTKPDLILEVAVKGMMNVLEGCLQHGVPELILASSSEVYQTPPQVPTDETAPLVVPDVLNPRYSYGGGKIISELLAVNYGRARVPRVLVFPSAQCLWPEHGLGTRHPTVCLRLRELHHRQPQGPFPCPCRARVRRPVPSFILMT